MAKWDLDKLYHADNRVNTHYIIDRLEDILNDTNQKDGRIVRKLDELRRELIYNLGANSRIKRGVEE